MEKRDYKIEQQFTVEGKTYETKAAASADSNLCKGCYFKQLVPADEDDNCDFYTCVAPMGTCCSCPNRIFVLITKSE